MKLHYLSLITLSLFLCFSCFNDKKTGSAQSSQVKNIDGMIIEILKEGQGPEAVNGKTAVVHYKGTLTNGKEFDSSYSRNMPFPFQLGAGRVIEGWDKGVLGMKVGEKRKLTIPPELAYKERGAGSQIPPNSTLVFEVELIEVK